MFSSVALDVVIGLVFIYLLYSLLATIVQEIIATFFSLRAQNLEDAISRMLDDGSGTKKAVEAFYSHPLIKYLGENGKGRKRPSYIKSSTFSKVVIDLLKGDDTGTLKPGIDIRPLIQKAIDGGEFLWEGIEKKIANTNSAKTGIPFDTQLFLKSIWAESQGDVDKFREQLENWFNETMDRASGWYKKSTQKILFMIGFALAIGFNVNTIEIAKKLEKDPELRLQVVQQADAFIKAHPDLDKELAEHKIDNNAKVVSDTTIKNKLLTQQELDSLSTNEYKVNKEKRDSLINKADSLVNVDIKKVNNVLGLGWSNWNSEKKNCICYFLLSLMGWLITSLAISLGAPFWFDLLNKLMKLRSSVATKTDNDQSKTSDGKEAPKIDRKG